MKNVVLTFAMLFSVVLFAQDTKIEKKEPKMEKQGDLIKATHYHANGEIAQWGFYKDGRLHGEWISFDEKGNKLAMASYYKGKKVGVWTFWKDGERIEVDYGNDSRILDVTKKGNSIPVVVN